ncbi:Putative aliphatic sulfonates transport permease protein SsuC [Neomoorella glycerini]|uniref:Aliphatic sulfonates transport permease protein SsuC n=1 Tax=Neomoorella glycerini TaxID=55779 RepID=A0A6I5ZU57_9FIRM|nr:ABC transporter permease [Moorella glycerini]QGP93582.1 Putative aliphatic sulfonates transport permease protein SsuC [Moorella glycerini]
MRKYLKLNSPIPGKLYFSLSVAAFALLLLFWYLGVTVGHLPPSHLPPPGAVARAAVDLAANGLISDIGISFFRVTTGFLLAAAIGVPLGILMGSLKVAEAFFEPLLAFFRYMPASAFIPLTIIWLSIFEAQKIGVVFIGIFFQLVLMIMDVTHNVPQDLIDTAYTLGARPLEVFRRVILPAALPGIMDTLRVTLGWAWTYVIVAELVAANSGLGFLIMNAGRQLSTPDMFVGILTIGVLGIICDMAFKALNRLLFPWTEREV